MAFARRAGRMEIGSTTWVKLSTECYPSGWRPFLSVIGSLREVTMSRELSITQSAQSVRQVLTGDTLLSTF